MYQIKPKKHLGQHFLINEAIAKDITDALSASQSDLTIEIGPGMGVLTKHLIHLENFVAYDIDPSAISYLKETYPLSSNKFVCEDVTKLPSFCDNKEKISIIGNFPYNITSVLFFKIWEEHNNIHEVVCMIQKEVAKRLCAKHGSKVYGILSVLLQVFFDCEYLFEVPPEAFKPPPKVHSAVVRLKRNDITSLPFATTLLKKVVKTAFAKRRKTLRNALKHLGISSNDTILEKWLNLRAEQLSVNDFILLTKYLSQSTTLWK